MCQIRTRSLILGQIMNSLRSLFTPTENVILSEGKKRERGEAMVELKLEKLEVLFCIMKHQYKFLENSENYHVRVHSINVDHDSQF